MTWLSRLLPQSPRLPRLADQNRRTRQGQRRRRMATLETLEGRTLLSNVTVSFPTPSSPLTITGDTFNDNFTITENPNGTVTVAPGALRRVPGVKVVTPSTIDGSSAAFTTPSAVTSIIVNLPGTINFDFVTLTGQGKTTATTVKNVTVTATGANLNFAATNVDDSGNFVLSNTYTSPVNAVLTATVDNSSFATLSITQTGGGPDPTAVELGNDSIPASVYVSEGNANGDYITLDKGDTFGGAATTLLQGNGGPTNSNSAGNLDTVSVTNASVKNLTIQQLLNGNGDSITVNTLSVASTSFGVTTLQGNGNGDTTAITLVTTPTPPNPNLPLGTGPPNIIVVQGSGTGDIASVTSSTLPGSISITQNDVAGSPGDTATISGDKVGYTATSGTTVLAAYAGNLTISQGSASIDTATVSNSTAVGGNVSISQGNGGGTSTSPPGDSATVTGVIAGTLLSNGTVVGGNITITQGTGSDDSATVSGSTALGYVYISQSDVAGNPFGDTALVSGDTVGGNVSISQGNANGDTATIDPTTVGGFVGISQGDGNSDTATVDATTVGGYVGIIQGDGNSDTATVDATTYVTTVGGYVSISQGNGNSDIATVDATSVGGYVYISQGNGNSDIATADATSVGDFVSISQGDGGGDTATVDPLSVGGDVYISQGNGNSDTATVEDATVGGSVGVTIIQGSGSGDTATVLDVTALNGNIYISQSDVAGNALGDTANVFGVTAGTVISASPYNIDVAGTVTITQGNAPGDVAHLDGDAINNVSIYQGDNVQAPNGSTVVYDVAEINDTSVTSNIIIVQGTGNSTASNAGYYVAAIGYDYLGNGTPASSSVTAGGDTYIYQFYANNSVFLGDALPSSFTTTYLDVFTGNGGGANVSAENTTVYYGSYYDIYTIDGGGTGNTYFDYGDSATVTVDPANFNSF